MIIAFLALALLTFSPQSVETAFNGNKGALVVLGASGEKVFLYNPKGCEELLPPCSTFKIWNSAIGLEEGIVSDPDAAFWKWDGEKRWLAAWNKDQTMRSAFAASCVPAYQALARKTGAERMAKYLHKISYGNENISSGIDVFWLPAPDRKPLLISPMHQAKLIAQLVNRQMPFSPHTFAVLKDVMKARQTERGILYGKTGTGEIELGVNICWYVGYVESAGKAYPFACVLKGKGITGLDTRTAVEKIFTQAGLL
ncbi:MAG: penicillin-binding transpeptidase domain-containing protein [Chthoniobacterales bacterium]